MKTGLRKVWRDLLAHKLRTVLVAFAISAGVVGVISLVGSGNIMINQMVKDIQADKLPMQQIFVRTNAAEASPDPLADLDRLETDLKAQDKGIRYIEGRATFFLQWQASDQDNFNIGYIRSFSEPFEDLQMSPPRLIEGEYPRLGQKEVAIEVRMRDKYELEIGDKLNLRILSQPIDAEGNIPQEEWTITGILVHSYADFTGGVITPGSESIYFQYADGQYVGDFQGFSALFVRYETYADTLANSDSVVKYIQDNSAYDKVSEFKEDPSENSFIEFTREYINAINALGIISVVVSGLLVFNVINAIVNEQKRQIGIMKSLGATTLELIGIYALTSLVYGVLGTVPGVLFGVFMANEIAHFVAPFGNVYLEGFHVSGLATTLGIVLGLAIPVLAALIPVFLGTRVSILAALSDMGISATYGKGFMANLIGNLPLPMNVRQALSNLWQKKGRLFLTGITLTLAIAAFMGVSAVFIAVSDLIEASYDLVDYEIQLTPNQAQDLATIENVVGETGDVEAVYGGYEQWITVKGYIDPQFQTDQLPMMGVDPSNDVINVTLLSGKLWQEDTQNGIILTKSVADRLKIEVGDSVNVIISGDPYILPMIGISNYPFDFGYLYWETFAKMLSQSESTQPTTFYLQLKQDEPTAAQVSNTMSDILDRLSRQGIPARMLNQVEVEEAQTEQFMSVGVIFNIAAVAMGLVGAVGLLITLSMAVLERQKEIGVMRSIGASSGAIVTQFLVEGVLVSFIAWLVAVPVSFLISNGLIETLPFGEMMEFNFPLVWLLYGLVASIVVATIASLWPSITAARKTVSEILRYQ